MKEITEEILKEIAEVIIKDINTFDNWQGKSKEEIINTLKTYNINFIETPEDFYSLKGGAPIAYYCKDCGSIVFSPSSFRVKKIEYFSKMLCVRCRRTQTNIELFGCDNPMKNKDIVAKGRETWNNKSAEEYADIYRRMGETRRNKSPEEKAATLNKIRETKTKNSGDPNAGCFGSKEFKEGMIKKYGVDVPTKNPKIAAEVSESLRSRTPEQREETRNKIITNNLAKRGYEWHTQDPEVIEKIDQSTIASLGVKRPLQSKICMDEYQNTMLERHGGKTTMESPELKARTQQTNIELYGNICCLGNAGIRSRAKETLLENYGCEHPIVGKYNFYGLIFDSAWELAVWIYHIDHGIPITREPVSLDYYAYNGKPYKFYVDFMIDGKLVEIKGDHFFRPDGTMYCPFRKSEWSDEKYEYECDLAERKHQCGLQHGVEFWKGSDCEKYLDYCNNKYPGWSNLYRRDNPWNPSYNCLYYFNPGHMQPPYFAPISNHSEQASPFDKPDDDGFIAKGKGITPFD